MRAVGARQTMVMQTNRKAHKLIATVVLVGLAIAPFETATASVVRALDLEELTRKADCIAVAQVIHTEAVLNSDRTISTWSRLRVQTRLQGETSMDEEIIIETWGGQIGDIGMQVEGEPSFAVGERVIVFARKGRETTLRAIGMGQGVFRIRTEGSIDVVAPSRHGMQLVRRNDSGVLQKSTGALAKDESLAHFLERVKALLEAQREELVND